MGLCSGITIKFIYSHVLSVVDSGWSKVESRLKGCGARASQTLIPIKCAQFALTFRAQKLPLRCVIFCHPRRRDNEISQSA